MALKDSFLRSMGSLGMQIEQLSGRALHDYVESLDTAIVAGGEEGTLDGRQLLGIQALSSLLLPIVFLFIITQVSFLDFLITGPVQILTYLGLISFGFYFPLANIKDRMKKRQKKLTLELPDTIDLLTVSVEAGLDFMGAMKRVMDKMNDGPLKDELEYFFKQVELGRTRREGLKDLATRTQLPDLSNVCSALIQADRLGSSIGPILRVQSDMLRIRRGQRAEKAAMEAPVKMLAPLLLCIFPAVFIVIFAPLFIQMMMDWAAQ